MKKYFLILMAFLVTAPAYADHSLLYQPNQSAFGKK